MDIRNHFTGKRLAGGLCILLVAAGLLVYISSSGGQDNKDAQESGPGQTVEGFYSDLIGRHWEEAEARCDSSATMLSYISRCREEAGALEKADQAIASIVPGLIDIEIVSERKTKGGCIVDFRIGLSGKDGKTEKSRKAHLRKEEGEWKITEIAG